MRDSLEAYKAVSGVLKSCATEAKNTVCIWLLINAFSRSLIAELSFISTSYWDLFLMKIVWKSMTFPVVGSLAYITWFIFRSFNKSMKLVVVLIFTPLYALKSTFLTSIYANY